MRYARWLVFLCVAALACGKTGFSQAAIYYVAPTGGDDANDGSIDSPFATIPTAIAAVATGDTIFLRGGTFNIDTKIRVESKSGADGNPIKLWAYPGEQPVLDFAGQAYSNSNRGVELASSADWWHLKGLTIQNAGDNGLNTGGDHGVFEQIVTRYNRDSGFQLGGSASFNLVLNCDSHENYDPQTGLSSPRRGENADGFAVKSDTIGPGNIFRGDRAWRNSDDGWDMFESRANGVLIENSWAYENGTDLAPDDPRPFGGDANGFKLGHDSGAHVLVRVAAWNHSNIGIDVNGNGYIYNGSTPIEPNGNTVKVINSTSYNNSGNYLFDEELPHVLRNNVSFEGHDLFAANVAQQLNTWNNIPVNEGDFITLDDARSRGPRRADGSLPLSDFLRLELDSNLVDAGTPLNYAFAGKSYVLQYEGVGPDLGAFEAGSVLPVLPGDYNGDHLVDAADYTVWRNMVGQSGDGLAADGNGDDEVDDEDYLIWKENFGASPGSGSTAVSVLVPEPAGWLLVAMALVTLVVRRSSAR